jgi:hypothetical protein
MSTRSILKMLKLIEKKAPIANALRLTSSTM